MNKGIDTSNLAANIWKLYLIKTSKWFMVFMPIIVLFFQSNGLDLRMTMTVNAIYSLSVAAFEIPSGYFSDRLGRKRSILLGTFFITLQFTAYSFAYSFGMFAFGAVLGGLGASFISGTDSAMLYDSLYALDRTDDYIKWEGRSYAVGTFSEAVAAIIGGALALNYGLRAPMYMQVGISFIGVFSALTLVEPPKVKEHTRSNWDQMKYILRYTFLEHKQLRFLLFLSTVFGIASLILAWFAQPYFDTHAIEKDQIGYLWAALNVTVACFSLSAYRIATWFTPKQIIFSILIGFTVGYGYLGFYGNVLLIGGLIALFIMYALRGLAAPTLLNLINQYAPSDMRATVLSIRGFSVRILYALFAPLLGWIADVYTIHEAFLAMLLIIGLATAVAIGFYSLVLQKK